MHCRDRTGRILHTACPVLGCWATSQKTAQMMIRRNQHQRASHTIIARPPDVALQAQTTGLHTCSRMLKTSGCAFSISSSSTTEKGRRRTASVSLPPSLKPT